MVTRLYLHAPTLRMGRPVNATKLKGEDAIHTHIFHLAPLSDREYGGLLILVES